MRHNETMKPDFFIIPYQVYENEKLTQADGYLYGVIYWLERLKDGKCTASNATLASIARMTPGSVQNSLLRLEEQGCVQRVFQDKARKVRSEIKCLVSYLKTAPMPMLTEKTCKYCGDPDWQVFVQDHIIPKSKGGSDEKKNLQMICKRCNAAKGDSSEAEFVRWLGVRRVPLVDDTGTTEKAPGVPLHSDQISNKEASKRIKMGKGAKAPSRWGEAVEIIDLFKAVNPSWETMMRNKTECAAAIRLLDKYGRDKLEGIVKWLPKVNGQPYAPTVTSPWQLESKLGALKAYADKERSKGQKNQVGVIM